MVSIIGIITLLIASFALTAFVFKNPIDKIIAFLVNIILILLLVVSVSIDETQRTMERLKEKYPTLSEVMYEEDLKKELETLSKDKKINDERQMEIILELGEDK